MTIDNEAPVSAYKAAEALKWAEENPDISIPEDDDESLEQGGERSEGNGADGVKPEKSADRSKGKKGERAAGNGESEESDAESEAGPDPEDDQEEDQLEEEEEGGDTDADESDLEDEVPELDPLIAELAKGNEKAEKRVAEIAKGLHKLKNEAKSLKSELEKTKPQAEFLESWNKALGDPNTVAAALQNLVVQLATHHKVKPAELLPILIQGTRTGEPGLPGEHGPTKTDAYGRPLPEWEAMGYGSEKEMQLEAALKAAVADIQTLKAGSEQLAKEREESRKATEFKAHVAQIAPPTIKKLEKLENGWKVTPQMVEKAITELPNWDPVRAVKAVYADELKTHHAKAVAGSRPKKGPEMPVDARGKGQQVPPAGRFSAADALRLVDG